MTGIPDTRALGVDPASRVVGLACLERDKGGLRWRGGERLTSNRKDPFERVDELCELLNQAIHEYEPTSIFIEVPDGKVYQGARRSGGRMAVYGYAVGRLEGVCRQHSGIGLSIMRLTVSKATGNRPKDERQRQVAAAFRQYDPSQDKGCDVSDAAWAVMANWRAERG
jgi:hypothetical protein